MENSWDPLIDEGNQRLYLPTPIPLCVQRFLQASHQYTSTVGPQVGPPRIKASPFTISSGANTIGPGGDVVGGAALKSLLFKACHHSFRSATLWIQDAYPEPSRDGG
jgi:hypothetical protein